MLSTGIPKGGFSACEQRRNPKLLTTILPLFSYLQLFVNAASLFLLLKFRKKYKKLKSGLFSEKPRTDLETRNIPCRGEWGVELVRFGELVLANYFVTKIDIRV